MNGKPLISVITVVYNGSGYIESTIKSVINQSYPHLEYIIIDGASADGTQDILQKYQKNLSYWISEPDQGIYDAMNKGLKMSHGDYVTFLNCGDSFYDRDILFKVFNQPEADVYYGETMLTDRKGIDLGTRSQLSSRKLPERLTYKSFLKGMVVSHQALIVRRAIAPLYDLRYRCSADINWCITVLKRSHLNIKTDGMIVRYLTQGFSMRNRKRCWIERFRIFVIHFGIWRAFLSHIFISARYFYYLITGRPNY
jgi:glycosyltransferase involved in cell wall biosynthesis